jgi:hypothetical protein
MRVSSVRIAVVLLLSLSIAAKSPAQSDTRTTDDPFAPGHTIGVPFTATWQQSIWDHGKLTSQTTLQRVARASDGSTYCATLTPDGTPTKVDIDDLPNNRMITLYPQNHTYKLSTPQVGKFHTFSLEEVAKILEQLQEENAQGSERPPLRLTSLGVKQEDGMTLYGQKTESHVGDNVITEEWWISSDLFVKARLKQTQSTEEHVYFSVIRDVRRVEPDSTLFEIPKGYTGIK